MKPAEYGAFIGKQAAAVQLSPESGAPQRSALQQLLQAKALSDVRRYEEKQKILRKLMAEAPQDFFVDSQLNPKFVGITHRPTSFKLHVPRNILPGEVSTSYAS